MLVAVEVLHERGDAALVIEIVLDRLVVPLVAQQDAYARVEEGEFAIAVLKLLEIELGDVFESVGRRQKGNARTGAVGGDLVDDFERGVSIAMLGAHAMLLAAAPDRQLGSFGQSVHHRDADAMKAA